MTNVQRNGSVGGTLSQGRVIAAMERLMAARKPRQAKSAEFRQDKSGSDGEDERGSTGFTRREIEDVEERSSPRTPVIYEIVCRLGEEEMARPVTSLWWSGVAAGLSISFSLFAQAILLMHLPDTPWRPLITGLGYTAGFVMVVLARQQLFTENTITVVLPVMANFNRANVKSLVRMWGVVFLANMAGTLVAALFCTFTPVISPELRESMLAVSSQLQHAGWAEAFFHAIGAGFLIAAMVWLIPGAESAQFHVIVLMTYLIAIAGFAHVVAGSIEAFMLVFNGQMGVWPMLADFFAPVLIGNVIGGTALFALIAYAQVMQEI
jgi:formate/nitrite transporter FocA (FNT family)